MTNLGLPAGLIALVVGVMVVLSIISILLTVFWILEIVDVCRREFETDLVKVVWFCVVFFSHFIGSLVYHFAGRSMGTIPVRPTSPGQRFS